MDSFLKNDLKMAAYESAAKSINDRQESKRAQVNQAKGAIRGLLDSALFIESYKEQDLSNDKLDELGLSTDDHAFLVEHLDKICNRIKDSAKSYERMAIIYEGEQKGLDQAIDLIDKLNQVEVAKKKRVIRDLEEEAAAEEENNANEEVEVEDGSN